MAMKAFTLSLAALVRSRYRFLKAFAAIHFSLILVASSATLAASASGTAFFISANGEILTNAHVVEECQQIRVGETPARLLARDRTNDLALLATELHPALWAKWRDSVQLGEDIVVYGFPLAGLLASGGNVVTGNITALAGLSDDSRFLQISAPVQPGNSGAPLFDRQGNVVGVVDAKLDALKVASTIGDIPQNINFSIKASVAIAFLESQRLPQSRSASADVLSTPDIALRAQSFIVKVVCDRPATQKSVKTVPSAGSVGRPSPSHAQNSTASVEAQGAIYVLPVMGAPGDGGMSLAESMKLALAQRGYRLATSPGASTYQVRGSVELGPPSWFGQQAISIRWVVIDPSGRQSQKRLSKTTRSTQEV
jgi:S1-C subfamily serine protease